MASFDDDEPHPADRMSIQEHRRTVVPMPAPKRRTGADVVSILKRWQDDGPLVHEPTGLPTLDEATGGGPVYGTRWYLSGAPDAGKTALLIHIAHTYAARGMAVGLLAVDEEPGDVLTRLAQRVGFSRHATETRETAALEAMRVQLGSLPIRFYDSTWTIEGAASDLRQYADEIGSSPMLGIDSIQLVQCDGERAGDGDISMVHSMEMRVRAVRAVAQRHKMIVLATSEMARGAYRSRKSADRVDPMAASKWSSAVEYSARVLLSLRSVPGESDVIELEVPKNKHGRSLRADEQGAIYLRIDRLRQSLEETEAPAVSDDQDDGGRAREAAEAHRLGELAEQIYTALLRANAAGAVITSRRDLRDLVQGGGSALRERAVTQLIINRRVTSEGKGRPYYAVIGEP